MYQKREDLYLNGYILQDRNTDDHVMLTWETFEDGQGGWDDVSNDVIDSRTTGASHHGAVVPAPAWMANGAFPLCQKTLPIPGEPSIKMMNFVFKIRICI